MRFLGRCFTALFIALTFLMVSTVAGCLIWMFVFVWGRLLR